MNKTSNRVLALFATTMLAAPVLADNVINDDLIVTSSACVGNDCVNGESFGFDTIRMKENNLRLHFDDTSNSASFPNNDWRIGANSSDNGGLNKLYFEDATAGREIMVLEASAPANSIYLDDGGNLGLGTASPVFPLHIVDGNSPAIRIEQDGSNGFTAQTFDIAANETNFFVRDVTNGSALPFRIRPGNNDSSIVISAQGNVGLGTDAPISPIHGIGNLLIEDTRTNEPAATAMHLRNNVAPGNQTMLTVENKLGRPRIEFVSSGNAAQTGNWSMSGGSTYVLQERISGTNVFILDQSGNLRITGTLTEGSDKRNKMAIEPVDQAEILEKVKDLPVAFWTYKKDADTGVRHIGPMAQDFYSAFGTGASELGISTLDSSGVALAAIQALASENAELKARLSALETKIAD